MEKELLKTAEAAKYLCVSQSKLWKMCHFKEVTYYKVGRLNVFKVGDLQAYVEANRILTATELKDQAEALLTAKKKKND